MGQIQDMTVFKGGTQSEFIPSSANDIIRLSDTHYMPYPLTYSHVTDGF